MKSKKIIFFVLLLSLIQIVPVAVSGDIGIPCAKGTANMCGFNDIFVLINNIVKFFLQVVLLPLAIIIIAYVGFLFLTSGGNEEKRSKAKRIFGHLVIGILMVLGAWLIVYTLFRAFGYDTSRGRAGLSDKTLNWVPNNVNAVTTGTTGSGTAGGTSGGTQNNTAYKAAMVANFADPMNTRVTVTITPRAGYKMPILVSCLSGDGEQRREGQGTIASGSSVTTITLKLSWDTNYSCTVENPEGSVSMADPTDGEFRTPANALNTRTFAITKSEFTDTDLIIYYTNADMLGRYEASFSCTSGSTAVIPYAGVLIDISQRPGSFSYPLSVDLLNGIKSDTPVSCNLTAWGKPTDPAQRNYPRVEQAFAGTIRAPKQNALMTVFRVLIPPTIGKESITFVLNGSINVDPNIQMRCVSLGTNHVFQGRVTFDPTIVSRSNGGYSAPVQGTFNVPVTLPVAWSGYGLRPLSAYGCEVNGFTLRRVSGYPDLPVVPLISFFPVLTPPIMPLPSMLPDTKSMYPVSIGTPQIVYKDYIPPRTPGQSTFRQTIPDSVFVPVVNGFAVDGNSMNLSCLAVAGPARGTRISRRVVVSGATPSWVNYFQGIFQRRNDTVEGFALEVSRNPATGFMHSSVYDCMTSFMWDGRNQARSFIVSTPLSIDPREVGPVVLFADAISTSSTHAFFTVVASPRVENSVEYACYNISGNYSGQVTWPEQALGIRMPVAIPISASGPGLKPKTTYNCTLDGVTFTKEKVNYKFIIKTP